MDQAIAGRKAELERYLTLFGQGTNPAEMLEGKAADARGHIAALEAFRAGLADNRLRADQWERETISVMKAVTALQHRLVPGVTWEGKRYYLVELGKSVRMVMCADDEGERYPMARVTYRFERPVVPETMLPIELEPLFTGGKVASRWQTHLNVI